VKNSPNVKIVKITLERHIPLTEKTCPQCGKTFMGTKKAIYCSKLCSNQASYRRHADKYRQTRRETYRQQKDQASKQ
jgi:ribosomal protein S27AE